MAVRVDNDSFQQEVLDSTGLVLVDFYSDSCIPCKRLSPLLAELAEKNADLKVVKVNVTYEQTLVERYSVMAAPTLIFFKAGIEAGRLRGLTGYDELQEKITELVKA